MWLFDAITAITKRGLVINVPFRWTGFTMVNRWTFFADDEVKGLDKELVAMLDWARGRSGVPFIITRGLDTAEHNADVGGVSNSAHLRGLAVDLRARDSTDRFKILHALFIAGFKRIGVYLNDGHIHVDRDESLPQNVFWMSE